MERRGDRCHRASARAEVNIAMGKQCNACPASLCTRTAKEVLSEAGWVRFAGFTAVREGLFLQWVLRVWLCGCAGWLAPGCVLVRCGVLSCRFCIFLSSSASLLCGFPPLAEQVQWATRDPTYVLLCVPAVALCRRGVCLDGEGVLPQATGRWTENVLGVLGMRSEDGAPAGKPRSKRARAPFLPLHAHRAAGLPAGTTPRQLRRAATPTPPASRRRRHRRTATPCQRPMLPHQPTLRRGVRRCLRRPWPMPRPSRRAARRGRTGAGPPDTLVRCESASER